MLGDPGLEIHQVVANSPEEAIKLASEGIKTVDGVTEILGGSAELANSEAA